MVEPIFDKDGYLTEETWQIIKNWDNYTEQGIMAFLKFVQKAWCPPDWANEKDGVFMFAAGLSRESEDLIKALYQTPIPYLKPIIESRYCRICVIGVGEKAEKIVQDKIEELVAYFGDVVLGRIRQIYGGR